MCRRLLPSRRYDGVRPTSISQMRAFPKMRFPSIDYDPAAVMQNLVNLALLLMTPPGDVADYRFLRLHADHTAWAKRGVNLASPLRQLVSSPTVHVGFRGTMQSDEMLPLHHEPSTNSANERLPFRGVNYLFESGAFCHLQALAQSGQIYPLYCNLHHETVVDRLTYSLCTLNMPLGVLDLSNLWWDWPDNPTQHAHLLPHFGRLADQQSLLLCTDVMCNRIPLEADYAAYTIGFLDKRAREGAHAIDCIDQFRAATTNHQPYRSTQPIVWLNGASV